jgi:uncharacterized protein YfaS (alpha-2-macroglobulin family)
MIDRDAVLRHMKEAVHDGRVVGAVVLVVFAALVGLFLVLKSGNKPSPATTASNEPSVFTVTPEGDGIDRLTPIRVTFEKAPSQHDGSKIVHLEPAVEGQYVWQSNRTLIFQPNFPGLLRGQDYKIVVAAQPDAGLVQGVTKSFTTGDKLDVASVIPAPNDVEVPDNVQILVQFSRSVAPLTLLSAQPQDKAIVFNPPLAGKGEWLNTGLYRFVPDAGALQPNTRYTAMVPAGLSSAADGVLSQDYVWSFTTFGPALTKVTPDRNTQFVGPQQQIVLEFNQAMDRASVQGGVQVLGPDQAPLGGSFAWSQADKVATFTPAAPLAGKTAYNVVVPAGLKGANGGATKMEQRSTFTTVGAPAISRTDPANNATNAQRFGISIVFSNPMNSDSFEGHVAVSGVDPDTVTLFPEPDGPNLFINVALQPSTKYTVTLSDGITDRYGQALPPYSFSFTTGQRPPQVSFAIPGQVATYSAATEPILYFHATNVQQAGFTLYPLTREEMRAIQQRNYISNGPPGSFQPSQKPIATWTQNVSGPTNEVLIESTSLSRSGGPLPVGDYFVRSTSAGTNEMAFSVVDTGIVTKVSYSELLAWAIDMQTGQPVPNLALSATGPGVGGGPVTTDTNGLASFTLPSIYDRDPTKQQQFVVETQGGSRYGVASTGWSQGASIFDQGLSVDLFPRQYAGYMYTDRPMYRSGEEVDYKGVVREDDDATYSVPQNLQDLTLVINDSQGKELSSAAVKLNEFGTFSGSLMLPKDGGTGYYSMQLMQGTDKNNFRGFITSSQFLVAEFVRPEFQVTVSTPQPDYVSGDTIQANFGATFYFGGAVQNAKVDWSVLSLPQPVTFKDYEGYSFSDFDYYRQATTFEQPLRTKGTTTTDENGNAQAQIPAQISGNEGTQRYEISASVLDQSGQAVSESTTVTVHPAAIYAGIKPEEYIAAAGQVSKIDLVSVDIGGKPVASHDVSVEVYERIWVTTKEETTEGGRRYRSEPKDTLLTTLKATTNDKGEAVVSYTPTKSGTLRLVTDVTDAQGRTSHSAQYLWVSGSGVASWQVRNDDTLALVADKTQYNVGDTADILVPPPFEGAMGLVTVERGKIMTKEVRSFPTNSERLSIPITDASVPTIYVSVVLYRPPTPDDPVARYKVGYVELKVSTDTRALNVSVKPNVDQAKPGDTVHYDINVTDSTGKGVKSEVSVSVVDKAVLSLAEEIGPDGLHAFWFERGLGVMTASSLAVSVDRSNDVISEAAAGGKGGGGLEDQRLRQDFRNTAYWTAQLATDDKGHASVDVKLPDNLTTWHTQVRAVSDNILVGEGTNELVSTQPLLVRPALPRFLRVGDKLSLRTLVTNATKQSEKISVTLAAEGVEVTGPLQQTVQIAPGASADVSWPATVSQEGTAKLTITASGDNGLKDAVQQELPVYLDVTPETTATGGVVTDTAALETLYLPSYTVQGKGSLQVGVQASLTGSLGDSLGGFKPNAWDSTDQIASRVIATLAARAAEPDKADKLSISESQLQSDVAQLVSLQKGDGGWAWCRVCTSSDPQVTGWVMQALGAWQDASNKVDASVISSGSNYINNELNRPSDVNKPADPSTKAYLLYSLAAAGRSDLSTSLARSVVQQNRANLANWGRAYLLLAFAKAGVEKGDNDVSALLNDLAANVSPSANGNHWEDPKPESLAQTGPRTTALVLAALSKLDPAHALIEETARWLVVALNTNVCRTDVERAQAIASLSGFVQSTGERGASFSYNVSLGDKQLLGGKLESSGAATIEQKTVPMSDLAIGKANTLSFSRDYAQPGRMYYTLNLRYVTPAQSVEALNRGFAVSHEYTKLNDATQEIDSAKLGDIVRVTVTVIVPADRDYVVVEDMLPAGLEAIDPNLAIVDPALKVQLESERRQANRPAGLDYFAPWLGWYYNPWQQADVLDDRVRLSTQTLSKGVYDFVYYARATTPGDFFVAPAHAEESFFPDVFGRSDSGRFSVTQ